MQTTGDGANPSWVAVPTPLLATNSAGFLAWIYPTASPEPDNTGIFMMAGGYQKPGFAFTTLGQLGYHWNHDTTGGFQSGFIPPINQWSMVALVIEPSMATIYLGTGGTLTNTVDLTPQITESWGGGAQVGANNSAIAAVFQGTIDEMAMFDQALSFDQINSLYGAALGKTLSAAPRFVLEPTSTTRYTGLSATFQSFVTGSSPSYQWFKGSQALADGGNVSGAKTATLTLNNVASTDVGNYTLVATNSSGSITSSVVTLTVQARSSAAYEKAVLAANPISYWRLNETNDPSSGTLLAYDYVGGFNGTYGTAVQDGFNNVAGPRPTDGFTIFETNNTAMRSTAATDQSWVTAPQPALNTNAATFTMWVYPDGDQADWSGLLMNRSGDGEGVGLGGGTSHDMLAYTWNNNSTWSFVSGLTVPSNQWSFLTVAIEPTRAILYVANTNGMHTATNPIVHVAEAWGGSADIGNDPGFSNGRVFNGIVDEVAIFDYTLSPQQVQNLFQGTSAASRPTLTIITATGGKLTISWEGTGTLQSTPSLQGASTVWTDLGTTNPVTVTPTGTAQFYRVRTP